MSVSRKSYIASLFVFSMPFLFAPVALAQQDAPFTVGIVQSGGLLVPVATFDGMDWSSPWPHDVVLDENLPEWPDLPEAWSRGDGVLTDWTLWFERSAPPGPKSLYEYDWVDLLAPGQKTFTPTDLVATQKWCAMQIALATSLGDGQSHESDECLGSKRGVATTSAHSPEKVEKIDPQGADSRKILAEIEDPFNRTESEAVQQALVDIAQREGPDARRERTDKEQLWSGQWLDANRRRDIPLEVRESFRIREGNADIYYMEIVRPYQARQMKGCSTYSQLRAWVLMRDDADIVLLKEGFAMTGCFGKGLRRNTPVIFWRHAAGIDFLVRQFVYEGESWLILRIADGAVTELTDVVFGGA